MLKTLKVRVGGKEGSSTPNCLLLNQSSIEVQRYYSSHLNLSIFHSRDTALKSWDLTTGEELHTFGAHTETVTCVVALDATYGCLIGQLSLTWIILQYCTLELVDQGPEILGRNLRVQKLFRNLLPSFQTKFQ